MTQNDLELPPLESLDAFPRWLRTAEARLGMRFAIEDADIAVGRMRSAKETVRAWMRG